MNEELPLSAHDAAKVADARRRRWLFGSASAAAGLAGAALGFWRLTAQDALPQAVAAFWQLQLETPSGEMLSMARFKGAPLLVNFWATWCPPCIEELPLLDAFFRENLSNGWQVVGIAVDKPAAVREFLARQPLSFPSVMAGFAGSELSKSLGNISGGLPFTVTMGRDGNVTNRKLGKVSVTDLSSWRELK